jgi:tripartite-type tricarboxylate transporter receptor subunit TctC
MKRANHIVCFVILCLAFSASLAPVFAQTYPTKAVTFIVPYPPGGRTDLTARVVAQFLRNDLGQPVVVVNKGGAGGVIGAKEVASSPPDGYTFGFFSTGFLTAQYTVPTPTDAGEYDLVGLINIDPAAVAASTKAPFKTIQELVAYGKKNPGKARAGINPGASAQIFGAAFAKAAGLDILFVPFKGGSERGVALAGGHIDLDFDTVAPMKPLADANKIRILGIASDMREDAYKNIPTLKEQGVDLVIGSWHGIFAPKGTPAPVIVAVNRAMEKTAKNPEFVAQMHKTLLGVRYMNQADFKKFFESQDKLYKKIITDLGLLVTKK